MIALDTSVAIAAFAAWHEFHSIARQVMSRAPVLLAPVAMETFSVLTRLPGPHRVTADAAREFLAGSFPRPWPSLDGDRVAELLDELVQKGISGGASYDALVAATARSAGARLITSDQRAEETYRRMGVQIEWLSAQ